MIASTIKIIISHFAIFHAILPKNPRIPRTIAMTRNNSAHPNNDISPHPFPIHVNITRTHNVFDSYSHQISGDVEEGEWEYQIYIRKRNSSIMSHTVQQAEMMKKVELIVDEFEQQPLSGIERQLLDLGFVQKDADPAIVLMEHHDLQLTLEIELNEDGNIHGYEILTFEEMTKKQEKFRW
jgi:hypothetical protein